MVLVPCTALIVWALKTADGLWCRMKKHPKKLLALAAVAAIVAACGVLYPDQAELVGKVLTQVVAGVFPNE